MCRRAAAPALRPQRAALHRLSTALIASGESR
jgi:hypothetical protein